MGVESEVSDNGKSPVPPKRRYTLTIEADGHDRDSLVSTLNVIAHDLWTERSTKVISSGGYSWELIENDPEMTKERYEADLSAWAEAHREARRAQ